MEDVNTMSMRQQRLKNKTLQLCAYKLLNEYLNKPKLRKIPSHYSRDFQGEGNKVNNLSNLNSNLKDKIQNNQDFYEQNEELENCKSDTKVPNIFNNYLKMLDELTKESSEISNNDEAVRNLEISCALLKSRWKTYDSRIFFNERIRSLRMVSV